MLSLFPTIRDTEFTFDELQPETTYSFKVRAVNKDGYSPWTTVSGTTQSNPLEWAVKNIKATCTAGHTKNERHGRKTR